jgi:hypothetical protein
MAPSSVAVDLKPIQRVWKPQSTKHVRLVKTPTRFDHFGNEMPEPQVLETNSDSIWNTYEALREAEVEALAASAGVRP